MFCSLYNNMKRSRNIPHFHSKQACMSMWRRPHGQTALSALWWTIFHICSRFEHKLPQYPENTFDKIRLRDNVSSLHKICQIWCTTAWNAVKRLDVKILCAVFNITFLTFGWWRQWQEPNLMVRAQPSFGGRTRPHPRTAAGYRAYLNYGQENS